MLIDSTRIDDTDENDSDRTFTLVNEYENGSRLCSRCRKINFDRILAPGFVVGSDRRLICELDYVEEQEECDLCSLFRATNRDTPRAGSTPITLVAYSSNYAFNLDTSATCSNVLRVGFQRWSPKSYVCSRWILPTNINNSAIYGRSTSEGVNWTAIKNWLHHCDTNHIRCGAISDMEALRVIDCNTQTLTYLSNPSDKYVALSYVWGKSVGSSKRQTVNLDAVPALVADSIHVVKSLGLRYLWIDRYCISQNDEEEKHTLIQNMGSIYSNSKLTIIAACCEDPSWGLPGVSSRRRKKQASAQVGTHSLVSTDFDIHDEIGRSVWNTRGWTYQEALLSKRRLVFGKSQTYFQCLNMYCYEALAIDLDKVQMNIDTERGGMHMSFRSLEAVPVLFPEEGIGHSVSNIEHRIREFYHRKLSYESDIINAFNGMMEAFEMKFKMRNLCGLPLPFMSSSDIAEAPLGDLFTALQWKFGPWPKYGYETLHRVQEFPSWSWAGWRVNTHYQSATAPRGWIDLGDKPWRQKTLDGCDNVDIEFEDGTKSRWHEDRNHILRYSATRSCPRWLHFRGWTVKFTGMIYTPQYNLVRTKLGAIDVIGMTRNDMECVFKFSHESRYTDTKSGLKKETVGLIGIVLGTHRSGLTVMIVSPKPGFDYYEFAGCYDFHWPTDKYLGGRPPDDVVYPLPFRKPDFVTKDQSTSYDGIEFMLKDVKVG